MEAVSQKKKEAKRRRGLIQCFLKSGVKRGPHCGRGNQKVQGRAGLVPVGRFFSKGGGANISWFWGVITGGTTNQEKNKGTDWGNT